MHPGHQIAVTGGGPFGRAWFDCSCGLDGRERRYASKRAANVAAFAHHAAATQTTDAAPVVPVTAASLTASTARAVGHHPPAPPTAPSSESRSA